MDTSTNQRFWTIRKTLSVLTILAGLFIVPVGRAVLNDSDAAIVLRFYNEVVLPTPAGQYYNDMLWKHSGEMNLLYENHSEHQEEAIKILQESAPGMEALLNGQGDTVQITAKQIQLIQAEVDWVASTGSPALREDIERELERYPLEHFIGMTMSEALEYVNANFPADLIIEPTATPTTVTPITATPVTIVSTPSVSSCLYGHEPDCLNQPTLVPESGGEWAYYVFNNKYYFEYPSQWRIEHYLGDATSIWLTPTSDSPEGSCGDNVYFFEWPVYEPYVSSYDPLTYPQTVQTYPTPIWNRLISLPDFSGSEFLWKSGLDATDVYLSAIFYIPDFPTVIEARLICMDDLTNKALQEPDLAQEQYPNFHHLVESLRFWKP